MSGANCGKHKKVASAGKRKYRKLTDNERKEMDTRAKLARILKGINTK